MYKFKEECIDAPTSSYIANIKLNASPGIFSMSSQQKLVSVQKPQKLPFFK